MRLMTRAGSGGGAVSTVRALITGAAVVLWLAAPASAQWLQVNGPEPPAVAALGSDGGVLYQGSNSADAGDLFRSTDGGATWVNAGLPNGGVLTIFPHAGTVYVGTYLSGLHRSTDGGGTWAQVEGGLQQGGSYSAMAAVGSVLLLGADDFGPSTLHRSTDGGQTWEPLTAGPSLRVRSMAAHGATVYVGSDGGGVYRSPDAGVTWFPASVGLPAAARVEALAPDGARVLAGVSKPTAPAVLGLCQSTDGGASWTQVSVDLPTDAGLRFTSLAVGQGRLFAGLSRSAPGGGVYRSTNGGVHWTRVSDGLPDEGGVEDLLLVGTELFAATAEGAFRSPDDGGTWSAASHGTAGIRGVESLLLHEGEVYVGLTTNYGGGRGVWRSGDAGATWLGDAGTPPGAARALLSYGGAVWAGLLGAVRGVYRSTDGGDTWRPAGTGISTSTVVNTLHLHEGVLLAGCYEASYRSTDGGTTWVATPAMDNATSFVSRGGELYAGRYGLGVYRSTDAGLTWSAMSDGLAGDALFVNRLADLEGELYLASEGSGVYRWDGASWVEAGLAREFVDELLPVAGVLVAGSALGEHILYSGDRGVTWVPFGQGYAGGEPYSLLADNARLYVGSRGHALWARPLADLPALFADGFESGDLTAWSAFVP